MTLPATLRDASEDDLPAIVEIYNSTIAGRMATADTAPVSVESRLHWFRSHNARTRPLWVAELPPAETGAPSGSARPEICAWLSFNAFINGRPAYDATAEISVYVSPRHRRLGLGRRLLGEAIARAPLHGITTLIGFIWAHNVPSLRLFESFGFERWGHLPRVAVLDDSERDLAILGKRLERQKGEAPKG